MKFLLFVFCSVVGNGVFAQTSLNTQINEFALHYKLHTKNLVRLEAIRTDSTITDDIRLREWEKAFELWDKNKARDSFCIQNMFTEHILERCPCELDSYYSSCLGVKSYPLNYLLSLADQYEADGFLSEMNGMVLKNFLSYQVKSKEKIERDAQTIDIMYTNHFDSASISQAEMEQIVGFAVGDAKDLQEARSRISGFGQREFDALKEFLRERKISFKEIQSSIYKIEDRRDMYFAFRIDDYSHPLFQLLETSVARDFCTAYTTEEWKLDSLTTFDFLKYDAFFDKKIVSNAIIMKYLFDRWNEYELQKFEKSGTSSYLKSKGLLSSCAQFLAQVEQNFPLYYFMRDYRIESKSRFELLFIAAYNDMYFDLGSNWRGTSGVEFDVRSFDLTEMQLHVVDAILNMNEQATQSELQKVLLDQNFDDFETELSFRLACYLAFHQKHAKMTRDWNHTEFFTHPFVSEKKSESIPILAFGEEEIEMCKQVMNEILKASNSNEGTYCFTIYGPGLYSLSPKPNYAPAYEIFEQLMALKIIDYNAKFVRIVSTFEPAKAYQSNPSLKLVTIAERPIAPYSGPPNVLFRENANLVAEIVEFPDVEASFPDGARAMKDWLAANLAYPEISRELGDQGRVYVNFVVEADGSITGIEIPRSLTTELDREAKRLVREMPKWTPGLVKGEKVRSRCRIPITFTLE